MNILLTNGDFGTYELTPVSKKLAEKQRKETGEESILFQTDWDFPILARNLGWNMKIEGKRCKHSGTDGSITCPDCGTTASDFISAATEWLDANNGRVFRGKGEEYFI